MAAGHEQLEDEHREAEPIMLGLAHLADKGLALKFRRGILRFADGAGVDDNLRLAVFNDLERVSVNQCHQRRRRDKDIALVEVANDVVAGVERGDGGGQVTRCAVQIARIESGQRLGAAARVEHVKQWDGVLDMGHQVAQEGSTLIIEQVRWPGDGVVAARLPRREGWVLAHPRQLRLVVRLSGGIDLRQ